MNIIINHLINITNASEERAEHLLKNNDALCASITAHSGTELATRFEERLRSVSASIALLENIISADNMTGAKLRRDDLSDADLGGANLRRANLRLREQRHVDEDIPRIGPPERIARGRDVLRDEFDPVARHQLERCHACTLRARN